MEIYSPDLLRICVFAAAAILICCKKSDLLRLLFTGFAEAERKIANNGNGSLWRKRRFKCKDHYLDYIQRLYSVGAVSVQVAKSKQRFYDSRGDGLIIMLPRDKDVRNAVVELIKDEPRHEIRDDLARLFWN